MNVRSPASAEWIAETRAMFTSPSPSRRQCSRSAMSRNFKLLAEYITRGRSPAAGGGTIEEAVKVRQPEMLRNAIEFSGAIRTGHPGEGRQLRQRRFGTRTPRHAVERPPRTAPGEEVSDDPKRKVVADQVGARQQHQQRGDRHRDEIDQQPDAVMASCRGEQSISMRRRRRLQQIGRIDEQDDRRVAQGPECLLVGDRTGDATNDPVAQAGDAPGIRRPSRVRRARGLAPGSVKPVSLASPETGVCRRLAIEFRLGVWFRVQIEAVWSDRYQVNRVLIQSTATAS